jgi:hypothetical protein
MTVHDVPIMKPTYDARAGAAARARQGVHIPAELPSDAPPELLALVAEHAKLRTQLGAVNKKLTALEAGQGAAKRADAAAYSAAVRSGKPDPGSHHEDERSAAWWDAQRVQAGLRQAIADTLAELAAMIDANRSSWTAAAQPAIDAARKQMAKALRERDAAEATLNEQLLFMAWLADPTRRPWIPQAPS